MKWTVAGGSWEGAGAEAGPGSRAGHRHREPGPPWAETG